jgi:hypothetical protein
MPQKRYSVKAGFDFGLYIQRLAVRRVSER